MAVSRGCGCPMPPWISPLRKRYCYPFLMVRLLLSSNLLSRFHIMKLQYLGECKKILESFESLVNRLNSDSHHLQLEALTNIAKLLAIVEIFRTPQERRGVAEVITPPLSVRRLEANFNLDRHQNLWSSGADIDHSAYRSLASVFQCASGTGMNKPAHPSALYSRHSLPGTGCKDYFLLCTRAKNRFYSWGLASAS